MIIIESEASTIGNDCELWLRITDCKELKRTKDFISEINRGENTKHISDAEPVNPASQKLEKPKGMIYVLNGNSMLDTAKQIINAVEFSVDIPTGLAAINFNKDSEVSDKLKELIEYLRINAEWRD